MKTINNLLKKHASEGKNARDKGRVHVTHEHLHLSGFNYLLTTPNTHGIALATIATLAAAWWSVLPDHHGKPSANGVRVMRVLCATPHGARHASCTAHTGEGP